MKKTVAAVEKITRLRAKLKSRNMGKLRLAVYRSNTGISAQIIDDLKGTTLVQKNSIVVKNPGKTKTEAAAAVGKALAEEALTKKISEVYFDRRSYRFHGRVKALADAAREAGLKF